MTDYYEQELRPTGVKDEYQMFYWKRTLTAEQEDAILAQKAINEAEANKPAEV